jgi:peptide/nickel transport system substrate-binding protein
MRKLSLLTSAALVATLLAGNAFAANLTIGSSTEPSAIDPLFSRTGNNQNIAMQIFDRLVTPDATLGIHPGLAESWKSTDPNTWVVKLRAGVKFHDGKPLTADDVIFSLDRAKNVPNSPAPFSGNVAAIASMKAVDPLTIEFKTKTPAPDFIEQIGFVYILEKAAAEGKSLDDYKKGTAAIGTGPYKYQEWVPGDRVVLTRNENYWGKKQDFDTVTIKFITNDAARIAALRSGAVDLIDSVPPGDVSSLSKVNGIKLFSIASGRLIYLALDGTRDESPFVTGADGKPLNPNPLKKKEVRLALTKMVNTQLIVDRVLEGAGVPAGQLVPNGVPGNDPAMKPVAFDLEGAKKLLADAHVPPFGLTIHSSNDRFPGDAEVGQALGQMFARGGIKINGVTTQPYNVYATAATNGTFSTFVFSLGNTTPTSATGLKNLLMKNDKAAGTGSFNRTRYYNPVFDDKMRTALAEFDFDKRIALLKDATKTAFEDYPIIPLYWQKVYWAGKANLTYEANMSEDTAAFLAGIAK